MTDQNLEEFFIPDMFVPEKPQPIEYTFQDGSDVRKITVMCLERHLQHIATAIGRQVWPAAEVLGDYILANKEMFGGKTVLELGAGIGITSILVAPLCRKVVMTDYLDAVFELQKVNLARNKEYLKDANIFPVKLKWNEQLDEFAQRSEETAWDIIIASDVIYAAGSVIPLFRTVEKLLKRDGGKFVLINNVSRMGSNMATFEEAMKESSLEFVELDPNNFVKKEILQPVRALLFSHKAPKVS